MLGLFKKNTVKKSNIAFMAHNKILLGDKELIQELLLTDLYVLTKINGKEVLFDVEKSENFLVNSEEKTLAPINTSEQQLKINQLKSLIGYVTVEKSSDQVVFNNFDCQKFSLANDSDKIKLNGDVLVANRQNLGKTAYHAFYQHQQKSGLYEINLKPDEMVVNVDLAIVAGGNTQPNKMQIVSLEQVNDTTNSDNYLTYKVKK